MTTAETVQILGKYLDRIAEARRRLTVYQPTPVEEALLYAMDVLLSLRAREIEELMAKATEIEKVTSRLMASGLTVAN